MKPLPNDICRCYGQDCDRKLICQRYMTIRIDAPNTVRSYSLSMMDDNGQCKAFIEVNEP